MNVASHFRKLGNREKLVEVRFQDATLHLQEGANLAAELLLTGIGPFRHTPASGAPRSPYCMMGACFDCLVEIDGITRQACMLEVKSGMHISMPSAGECLDD